jgi:hypothetical protein
VNLQQEPGSLMNVETLAVNALALGAGAKTVYSAGQAPLQTHAAGNYERTPTGLLRAVPGTSSPGHMTFGPNITLAPGNYTADFVMRSTSPVAGTQVANVEVFNARTNEPVVPIQPVNANQFDGDRFVRISVPFTVSSTDNSLEYRVWWYGGSPLDVAEIRIR